MTFLLIDGGCKLIFRDSWYEPRDIAVPFDIHTERDVERSGRVSDQFDPFLVPPRAHDTHIMMGAVPTIAVGALSAVDMPPLVCGAMQTVEPPVRPAAIELFEDDTVRYRL